MFGQLLTVSSVIIFWERVLCIVDRQEHIIEELQYVIHIFGKEQQQYLHEEIGSKLTEGSQRNLYSILKEVLSDEILLLIELEIRRQSLRNKEDNMRNRKSIGTLTTGVVN